MLFGEKIGKSDSENSSKRISDQMDQFPFSALHFLRNRLMPSDISQCYNLQAPGSFPNNQSLPPLDTILPLSKLPQLQSKSTIEPPEYSPSISVESSSLSPPSMGSSTLMMGNPFCNPFARRPRGEKRPIPEEQKDEKYFERRRRNNEAAKKSRDARKMREDRIALRAALLEQENSILRAQTLALREEVCTLRQILCNRTMTAATSNSVPSAPSVSQS